MSSATVDSSTTTSPERAVRLARAHCGHRLPLYPSGKIWIQAVSVSAFQSQWIVLRRDPIDFVAFDDALRRQYPDAISLPKCSPSSPERAAKLAIYLQAALSSAPAVTQRFLDITNLGRYVHNNDAIALQHYVSDMNTWRDIADGTLAHYSAGCGNLVDFVINHCPTSLRDRYGLLPAHVAALRGSIELAHRLSPTEAITMRSIHAIPLQYRKAAHAIRALVLVNPKSGKGRAGLTFEKLVAPLMEMAGIKYEMQQSKSVCDGTNIALSFDENLFDTLICVSGDGLLHEVIQGLSRRGIRNDGQRPFQRFPIVIIPAGSGNAIASSLSGPFTGPYDSLHAFFRGCYRPADLIAVRPIEKIETETVFAIVLVGWGVRIFYCVFLLLEIAQFWLTRECAAFFYVFLVWKTLHVTALELTCFYATQFFYQLFPFSGIIYVDLANLFAVSFRC